MDGLLPGLVGCALGAAIAAAVLFSRAASNLASLRSERDRAAGLAETAARDRDAAEARATESRERLADLEHRREEAERTLAVERERLASLERRLAEEVRRVEELKVSMRDVFRSVGQEVTRGGLEELKKSVVEIVAAQKQQIAAEADARRQAIEAQMKPIQEGLVRQAEAIRTMEEKREGAYAGLRQLVESVQSGHGELREQTGRLVQALRRPETRGRWGEFTLRNAVEQAGLSPHCDFAEQVSVEGESGRLRPDLVVNLPGGGRVVVDSKVALDAFLSMLEPDADRAALLERHAEAVVSHMKGLAAKRYWSQFERSPEFVVMFVPVESALAAAIEARPTLLETGFSQRVVIAGPMNLVALLRVVATGWREHDVAENARKIAEQGAELHDRLRIFAGKLAEVGKHLERAGRSYDEAVGSFDRRLLPSARRMEELSVSKGDPVEEVRRIGLTPRLPDAAEDPTSMTAEGDGERDGKGNASPAR